MRSHASSSMVPGGACPFFSNLFNFTAPAPLVTTLTTSSARGFAFSMAFWLSLLPDSPSSTLPFPTAFLTPTCRSGVEPTQRQSWVESSAGLDATTVSFSSAGATTTGLFSSADATTGLFSSADATTTGLLSSANATTGLFSLVDATTTGFFSLARPFGTLPSELSAPSALPADTQPFLGASFLTPPFDAS